MQHFRRYAVYWAPEGAFADRAAAWLGWDPRQGQEVGQPHNLVDADRVQGPDLRTVTEQPRKYGFHGTLKAPFRLAEGWNQMRLVDATAALAGRLTKAEAPGLALARIGHFLAMIPRGDGVSIGMLAAEVVAALEPARAALTDAEILRRHPDRLSPRQRLLLDLWGYPYVMDEFRFHLTVSGALAPEALDVVEPVARTYFAQDMDRPFVLDAICLFGEAQDGRFHLVSRHALGG